MTRDSRVAAANACMGAHRCRSPSVLGVLTLALIFTAPASTPGFAEEAPETSFPEPVVRMNSSAFASGEGYRHHRYAIINRFGYRERGRKK
jgi:hypothetical protein